MTTISQTPRRRIMAAAMLAAAGATVAAGTLAAAAPADAAPAKTYVAISYSPETGHWGWGNQYNNLEQATIRSLSECQNAGGNHCVFIAWAENGCAALAVNGPSYYGWYGPTLSAAESAALQRNGGGHIEVSRCSW